MFKCNDPERESTFVPGEALNMITAMVLAEEDIEFSRRYCVIVTIYYNLF